MAEVKISALTAATGLTDDDVLIVNDGATTKKITAANAYPYMQPTGVVGGRQVGVDGPGYWNMLLATGARDSLNWGYTATGTTFLIPFPVLSEITLSALSVDCITASAGHSIKMAIFEMDGSTANLVANSDVTFDVGTAGYKTVALASNVTLTPGIYAIGHNTENGTPDLRSFDDLEQHTFGVTAPGVNIHNDRCTYCQFTETFASFPTSSFTVTFIAGTSNAAHVIGTVV